MDRTDHIRIWNRALDGGGSSPRRGDLALAALLRFDGMVDNGGVHHALSCLATQEIDAAVDGYAYFGFDEVAAWLSSRATDPLLVEWKGEFERPASRRYASLVTSPALIARVRRVLDELPDDFAPLEPGDGEDPELDEFIRGHLS